MELAGQLNSEQGCEERIWNVSGAASPQGPGPGKETTCSKLFPSTPADEPSYPVAVREISESLKSSEPLNSLKLQGSDEVNDFLTCGQRGSAKFHRIVSEFGCRGLPSS